MSTSDISTAMPREEKNAAPMGDTSIHCAGKKAMFGKWSEESDAMTAVGERIQQTNLVYRV